MALGVFCAGVLLFDPQIDFSAVVFVRSYWLARLIFLFSIGVSFGVGTTLAKII